jgi:pimeloyl-ACP methyl ester carboxylesterase
MRGTLVRLAVLALGLSAATPAHAAAPAKCDFSAEGLCGSVTVPLDRSHPNGAKIDVKYVLFKHTDASKPSLGTIFVTEGGPGDSVINDGGQDGYPNFVFKDLRPQRDIVLIDQRGVGQSGAISCEPLQAENTPFIAALRKCGEQLGTNSDLYGSADVAKDIDAIRADLGLQQFDFYGGSYAGTDIEAYAARFRQHLRSVVLDSAVYLPAEDRFFAIGAKQEERVTVLVCSRSQSCSHANPRPAHALRWLLRRLRNAPVSGAGRDASGRVHHLRVTEGRIAKLLGNDAAGFLNQSEIVAAAQALRHGDRAPLLRLAAENDHQLFFGDPSDPTLFSLGENNARFCNDQTFAWDKQGSESQRRAQFEQARSKVDPNQFAPFSVSGWMVPPPLGFIPDPCIVWPAPTHNPEPPIPAGTVIPGVPALILTGDLDVNVPPAESAQLTKLFPNSTLVNLKNAGHHTVFTFQFACSGAIVRHFLQSLQAGDTSCANRIPGRFTAVGRFPARVWRDKKGRPSARSAARITVGTMKDAFERGFLQDGPELQGPGLHGGTFHGRYTDQGETLSLKGARFARDLAVTGTIQYLNGRGLEAKLRVRGATSGSVRIRGLLFDNAATRLKVTGVIGGRIVKLTVPAT